MSFNKIIVVGHLGRDPELRYTPQGVPVCTFSVATSERRRDTKAPSGGESGSSETTTWFRVTLWREKAEIASKYLTKGRLVYVEGRLSVREWQDREGIQRTSLEITGTDVQFIDNRGGEGQPRENQPSRSASAPSGVSSDLPPDITDDDIPF